MPTPRKITPVKRASVATGYTKTGYAKIPNQEIEKEVEEVHSVLGVSDLPRVPAVRGVGRKGALAGKFEGDVEVTGDVRLTNADCAEDFDVVEPQSAVPGTVMVLGEDGVLRESMLPYDKRVVGVVSGAGCYKAALILDRHGAREHRRPIALLGKTYCKVDAKYGEVSVGDSLTTSPTPGHAMKACDTLRAPGAVIGKALQSLAKGTALVPILVALQ